MAKTFIRIGGLCVVALAVAAALAIIPSSDAYSGGGANWKVTVSNPTSYNVKVWVCTRSGNVAKEIIGSGVQIGPGSSHTWETGAQCPSRMEGQILVNGKWLKMRGMDCLGGDHNYDTAVMSTCCWNISARVCQKAGQGYAEVRDHDYGFCKN